MKNNHWFLLMLNEFKMCRLSIAEDNATEDPYVKCTARHRVHLVSHLMIPAFTQSPPLDVNADENAGVGSERI